MDNLNDTLAKLSKYKSSNMFPDIESLKLDTSSFVKNIAYQTPIVKVDEKSTFAYQMQQQTNQIIEKNNEQINLLKMQNEQLMNNYKKLEDLYELKEQELKDVKTAADEADKKAKKVKKENFFMMAIAVISMLVAFASWLFPNVGK